MSSNAAKTPEESPDYQSGSDRNNRTGDSLKVQPVFEYESDPEPEKKNGPDDDIYADLD